MSTPHIIENTLRLDYKYQQVNASQMWYKRYLDLPGITPNTLCAQNVEILKLKYEWI